MSWFIAFLGFIVLIIMHEFGHFAAAKSVGMRVERFMLFFPPILFKRRKGETEYGVGLIPLGGYVKITGMNPQEDIPDEVTHRAYYQQHPWKRIVVILAGPVMNLLIAFLIAYFIYLSQGILTATTNVDKTEKGMPAALVLKSGDKVVSVNGTKGDQAAIATVVNRDKCVGKLTAGCKGRTPLKITVIRDGKRVTLAATPVYDSNTKRMRLGFSYASTTESVGPIQAASLSVEWMWDVTSKTLGVVTHIFEPEQRKQLSSVVGAYDVAAKSVDAGAVEALTVLALISLSLAIINLFPFLPLDGGHIFWALAEKVRGKPIPFQIMEKASFVGFALVLMMFAIGLSNDIGQFTNGGFKVR